MSLSPSLRCWSIAAFAFAQWGLSSARAETQVIVDDTFADGDRTSQTPGLGTTPYTSIPWYSSVNKWVKTDNTGMVVTTDNGSAMIWGFFAPETAPLTLKTGESLTFSFDYTYSTDINAYVDFRFGLFNAGPNAKRGKGSATFGSPELKGYFVITRSQSTKPDGSSIYAENNAGAADAQTFNNKSDKVATVGSGFPAVDAKTDTHNASITVTRTSDSTVSIAASFEAGVPGSPQADTTMKLDSFDSAALYLGRMGEGNTVTISNLKVVLAKP